MSTNKFQADVKTQKQKIELTWVVAVGRHENRLEGVSVSKEDPTSQKSTRIKIIALPNLSQGMGNN
jgi:hypothetical protein